MLWSQLTHKESSLLNYLTKHYPHSLVRYHADIILNDIQQNGRNLESIIRKMEKEGFENTSVYIEGLFALCKEGLRTSIVNWVHFLVLFLIVL